MIYRLYTLVERNRQLFPEDAERLVGGTREDAERRFEERADSIRRRGEKERPAMLRLECIADGTRLKLRETDFRKGEAVAPDYRLPYAA